jgi:NadR type nicotinamide-nucleotide adenylyltransferase
VGPESTGKSTLAEALANHFHTEWVKEYAREYIDNLGRPYNQEDLTHIAMGQIKAENELLSRAKRIIICDTNLLVIKIWSEHKYGHCDPEIIKELENRKYDLHLLTNVDIPWQNDPQREHPRLRQYFYDIYLKELQNQKLNYKEIKGDTDQRISSAVFEVKTLL